MDVLGAVVDDALRASDNVAQHHRLGDARSKGDLVRRDNHIVTIAGTVSVHAFTARIHTWLPSIWKSQPCTRMLPAVALMAARFCGGAAHAGDGVQRQGYHTLAPYITLTCYLLVSIPGGECALREADSCLSCNECKGGCEVLLAAVASAFRNAQTPTRTVDACHVVAWAPEGRVDKANCAIDISRLHHHLPPSHTSRAMEVSGPTADLHRWCQQSTATHLRRVCHLWCP